MHGLLDVTFVVDSVAAMLVDWIVEVVSISLVVIGGGFIVILDDNVGADSFDVIAVVGSNTRETYLE